MVVSRHIDPIGTVCMKIYILAIITILGHSAGLSAGPAPALIPQPAEVHTTAGTFALTAKTPVTYGDGLAEIATLACEQLGLQGGCANSQPADFAIALTLDSALQPEQHALEVTPQRITVTGGSSTAVFHGVQTLRQLAGARRLATDTASPIPCLAIRDQPRFAWRGVMLDCSRTFQSPEYLKMTMDRLAFYKMNVLHLHLTDDQGWRLEIKNHPELTRKGARFSAKYNEPELHQGFYTQAQMQELVAYAKIRGITVVPEIEMPGHNIALLVCRPDLSCTGKIPDDIFPFGKGAGITAEICCAGNDNTFAFFEEVLSEVMGIFPSPYIHVGGDEAPKTRWKACPKCQARIMAENLKDEHQLQSYFIQRMEKFVNSKGRKLIGWDEILEGGLAPNAAVMSWRGVSGGIAAAKAGHTVVMTPTSHCYFDYDYKTIDEKHAYGFNPIAGIPPEQARYVIGLQANFWSHIDREPALVDRQLFPRLLSLAERAWSPASVADWNRFQPRLSAHHVWLSAMGIQYHGAPPPVPPM